MKFFNLLTALVLALASTAALSAPTEILPPGMTAVPLATITNDRDASVSHLELMLNASATVRGIYVETSAMEDSGSLKTWGRVYWLKNIESGNGVVLGEGQGVKAIFLRGAIKAHGDDGVLIIKYLTNGIFKHYAECRAILKRLRPYDWQLVNAYDGHPIKHIQVRTWMLGIETIGNVCPA